MVWYIITLLPLPAPFDLIVRAVFLLICLLVLVNMLLPFAGHGGFYMLR